jgi:hypothetical protein
MSNEGYWGSYKWQGNRLAEHFRFASKCLFADSSLYQQLCARIAEDPVLLNLAGRCRTGEPPSFLLLGAINYVDALVPFQNVEATPGDERDAIYNFEYRYKEVRERCLVQKEVLLDLISTRRVQTNEVGRSSLFALGAAVGSSYLGDQRFHVIDLGASAGLNLFWDTYRLAYWIRQGPSKESKYLHKSSKSNVFLECQLGDAGQIENLVAEQENISVIDRVGIEIEPIDRDSPEDLRWLRALMWHGQFLRRERFDAALEETKDYSIRLVKGDASKTLLKTAAGLSTGDPLLVTHSHLFDKLSIRQKQQLRDQLAAAARKRPLIEVGVEHEGQGSRWWVSAWSTGGTIAQVASGRCHPHGGALTVEAFMPKSQFGVTW